MNNKQKKWWETTTIYQIYPRSFKDSNGDGIGDLRGIINQLDYIKDLGVESIWCSPFYESPQADFGYDVSNYLGIAPEYGNMGEAEELISEVHQRGMKIVFDMVMNHTSDQHPWFLESKSSRDNPKHDWYIWRDGKGKDGKQPPNNWKSIIGSKGWNYCEERKQWYYTSFLSFQPDLNYHNPEVKKQMFDAVRFWMAKGVDGFRLDIFNCIYKDESFKDNPFSFRYIPSEKSHETGFFQTYKYTVNQPKVFELAHELRAAVDNFEDDKDRFLIGEVFGDNSTLKKFMGAEHKGLNFTFLFETLDFKFSAKFFRKLIQDFENEFPAPYMPVYVFSNHDRMRSITRINDDHEKAKLLALIQTTTRGIPVIYQGEEIGQNRTRIPIKEALDPLAKLFAWVPQFIVDRLPVMINRDECRSPMQWDSSAHAGFCSAEAKPWIRVNDNYPKVNVAKQAEEEFSLLNVFRKLLQLRKETPQLNAGKIELNTAEMPSCILSYRRYIDSNNSENYIVFMNFSNKKTKLKVDKNVQLIFKTKATCLLENGKITLGAYDGVIIKTNS